MKFVQKLFNAFNVIERLWQKFSRNTQPELHITSIWVDKSVLSNWPKPKIVNLETGEKLMDDNAIRVIDDHDEDKYAAKTNAEIKEVLEYFKDLFGPDRFQLNDVSADKETYMIKRLVATCQKLSNIPSRIHDSLTIRD